MQIKLRKQVHFAKGTQKQYDKIWSIQQNQTENKVFDIKEWEKQTQITESEFAATCKQIISCQQCSQDLICEFKNLFAQFQNRTEKYLFLSSDLKQYRTQCDIHNQIKCINKRQETNNTATFIDNNKLALYDFPKFMKEVGQEIIISSDIFKAKINFFLRQMKSTEQFSDEKDIAKQINEIIDPDDNVSFNDFICIRENKIIINYNYTLFEKVLKFGTTILDIQIQTSIKLKLLRAISSIIMEHMIQQMDKQVKKYYQKINFIRILKTIIIQKIEQRIQTIEDEKKQELFFQSLEKEEKQLEARKEKQKKKREKKKQQRKLKKNKQSAPESDSQEEEQNFSDEALLLSFQTDQIQQEDSQSDNLKTLSEIHSLVGDLTQFNQQRKILRETIRKEWENYEKQFSQIKQK